MRLGDEQAHSWVMSHRGPGGVTVARVVTWGGVTGVVLPALAAVGAVAARSDAGISRRLGSGLLLSGAAAAGIYAGIQVNALVRRDRPPRADWAGSAGGLSFPSGHTTAATLFAVSGARVIAARAPAGWARRTVWAGAAAYAAAVGWSRVWLGVHWPTDVIAGWLFGCAWVAGSVAVIRALLPASEPAAEAVPPGAAVRVVDHPVHWGRP